MGIQINGTNDTISAADGSLNINGSILDTIGINGASPQTPIDVISNSSGNGITVRGRSADGLGNIRFTSNNYATLYGGFKHDASTLTIFNELTGSLKLGTSGIDRVTIDSSGRVTMPYQPAFLAVNDATTASDATIASGSPVYLDFWKATKFNIGSGFNTTNGYFVAPVSGRYFFDASISVRTNTGVQIVWNINGTDYSGGTDVLIIECYNVSLGALHANGGILLSLSAGDIVRLRNRGSSFTCGRHHSHWSGFLVG